MKGYCVTCRTVVEMLDPKPGLKHVAMATAKEEKVKGTKETKTALEKIQWEEIPVNKGKCPQCGHTVYESDQTTKRIVPDFGEARPIP